jgi:hypothetical protein
MFIKIIQELNCWAKNSIFFYPLLLSIISALIFWLVFSYLPRNNRKRKLRPVIEVDLLYVYTSLFHIFDLIMMHHKNSPSYFQDKIRGNKLTKNNIKLGLQNKCLNENYLFDSNVNKYLIPIGEEIYENSNKIDLLISKIFNFSQYVSSKEILLLEQIREELKRYDYDEDIASKNAEFIIGGQKLYPLVSIIYYRVDNFFKLYELFTTLQNIVLTKNKFYNRDCILYKIQFYYYSFQFSKCKKIIKLYKKKFPSDNSLYQNYLALCEYHIGNKDMAYNLLNSIYKDQVAGSLISSRDFLKSY